MAQEFEKPFDSPAVIVVGHQTDGKSALVEALMGFQMNHVGGGTKTRRPIAINSESEYHPGFGTRVGYTRGEGVGSQSLVSPLTSLSNALCQ